MPHPTPYPVISRFPYLPSYLKYDFFVLLRFFDDRLFNDSAPQQSSDVPMAEDSARYRYRWERITELATSAGDTWIPPPWFFQKPYGAMICVLRRHIAMTRRTTAICRLEALKTALNAPDGHFRQCLISTLTRYGGETRRAGGERAIPFNLKAIRFGFTLASHISQKPVFVTFREIG